MSAISQKHIPALDGLRGVAILLVLMHHFVPERGTESTAGTIFNVFVAMGWSGVDLFFVLSGFLITGILLDEKGSRSYFTNFYARRILRIFPLYYGWIALSPLICRHIPLLHGGEPEPSLLWWVFYASNTLTSFFPNAHQGLLGHFWSLAVEEQFYLVWPAMIYFASRRSALRICVACLLAAWLARQAFILGRLEDAAYPFTICRVDALAAGSIAAFIVRDVALFPLAKFAKVGIGFASISLVVIAFWRHGYRWDPVIQQVGFPLNYGLATCILLLVVQQQHHPITRVLSFRVLRSFGRYSYGIYVLHTLLAYLSHQPGWRWTPSGHSRLDDVANFVLLTALAYAMGFLSFHAYEKWFLRLKKYFDYQMTRNANPTLKSEFDAVAVSQRDRTEASPRGHATLADPVQGA